MLRLVGAVLAEQHDEWAVARRYMSAESLAKTRIRVDGDSEPEREEVKELGSGRLSPAITMTRTSSYTT